MWHVCGYLGVGGGEKASVPRTLAPLLRAASLLRSRVLNAQLRSDRRKIPFAPSGDEITSYLLLADVSGPASPPPRAGGPTLVNGRPDWRSRSQAAWLAASRESPPAALSQLRVTASDLALSAACRAVRFPLRLSRRLPPCSPTFLEGARL